MRTKSEVPLTVPEPLARAPKRMGIWPTMKSVKPWKRRTAGRLKLLTLVSWVPMRIVINFGSDSMTKASSEKRRISSMKNLWAELCSGPLIMTIFGRLVDRGRSLWSRLPKKLCMARMQPSKRMIFFYDFSFLLRFLFPVQHSSLIFHHFCNFPFRFSATSVSISTSETARVERLRLTRKQLAALARYTLLHLSNHQSTVLNTQLEFSLFKEALPCFELLIFSSAHTAAEKH